MLVGGLWVAATSSDLPLFVVDVRIGKISNLRAIFIRVYILRMCFREAFDVNCKEDKRVLWLMVDLRRW